MDTQLSAECRQDGDYLIAQTRIDCVEGISMYYRTLWRASSDRAQIVRERAELTIGSVSLCLGSGPTPTDHIAAVRAFSKTRSGQTMSVNLGGADSQRAFKSVFLAIRNEGCEVFTDEASARFWAVPSSDVKMVSLRAASSALKTDEESVIESAIAATQSARLEMSVAHSIVEAADSLQVRLRIADC